MEQHAPLTHKVLLASAWLQFALYSITFGLLIWLIGSLVIGEPAVWWIIAAQAVVYGLIMTWLTRRTKRQTERSLGLKPDLTQRIELANTLKTAKLPDDPALRAALPGYLASVEKQNRRMRVVGPVEFLIFTGLALYLAMASDNPAWYAFTGLFIGFGLLCYLQPTATLERISKLRRSLKRAAKKATAVETPKPAKKKPVKKLAKK